MEVASLSLVSNLTALARAQVVAGKGLDQAIDEVLDDSLEAQGRQISGDWEPQLRQTLATNLTGFGPLQPLLDDPTIEEIWINDEQSVFVARSGISSRLPIALPLGQLATVIERMLRPSGRRLDRSSPFVDASLPDGSRLHVVIPQITKQHWSVNIRKFPEAILTLLDLVELGTLSAEQADFLSEEVISGANVLISGATQAGKTTVLCALLDQLRDQRIISVEETFEIRTRAQDWVALQTRAPNLEGIGEVTLRRLVKEALRMRPGRIVVGEVREAESFDLLIALNSGLPGLCTIHANSAQDAIAKLCTLPLLAGGNITADFVRPTVGSCIDIVVHCELLATGRRRISEIARLRPTTDGQGFDLKRAL